jgi:hypothetical protein
MAVFTRQDFTCSRHCSPCPSSLPVLSSWELSIHGIQLPRSFGDCSSATPSYIFTPRGRNPGDITQIPADDLSTPFFSASTVKLTAMLGEFDSGVL